MSEKPKTLKEVLAYTGKVLPIITEELTADQAVKTAKAVYEGGARAIEFCLRTEDAESKFITKDVFDKIRAACPGMLIGVGTIQQENDFAIAQAAGADFTVSATYSETLINAADKRYNKIPFIPNIRDAQMVSDIMHVEGGRNYDFNSLRNMGVTGFKVSALSSDPFASTGNANATLAIMGNRADRFPPDMSIICTEGVFGLNQFNINNFPFKHPCAAGVGGTWMWQQIGTDGKPYSMIQQGAYSEIEAMTRLSLKIASGEQLGMIDNAMLEKRYLGTRDYAKRSGLLVEAGKSPTH